MSKNKRIRFIGYGIGLAIIAVILYIGGTQAIELAITPRPGPILACLLANLAVFMIGAYRWGYIIDNLLQRKIASYPKYFFYFVSSRFLGQYISQAGGDFVVKPGLLKQIDGVSAKSGLLATFVEKLFDLSLIAILILPSFLNLFGMINDWISIMIVFIIAAIFLVLLVQQNTRLLTYLTRIYNGGLSLARRIPIVKNFFLRKKNIQPNAYPKMNILKRRPLLLIYLLSILRFLLLVSRLYFLNLALDLGIPLAILIVGIPISQLTLALAITPGALGILEGGWYAILTLAGIPEIERSAFLIGQRVYWSLFIGVIFLVTYMIFGLNRLLRTGTQKNEC